jgi:branched-chain amino acid aminotransferase
MTVVYLNGQFLDDPNEAKVSVWDHGFLYGDGIFEGIRVYEGNIFKCREHMQRLYDSAKTIAMEIPMSLEEMESTTAETVKRSGMTDCYIRLVVSRGKGDLGLDPRKCHKPTIVIIVDKIQLFPPELYETGVKTIIASTRKNHVSSLNPNIKSLNYLNNIMAKIEAVNAGVSEAFLLNQEGYITEGTADNFFLVKNGVLKTPPASAGILKGITRDAILECAERTGIPFEVVNLTNFDAYSADEIFLSGTGAEMIPVIELDKRVIGSGQPGPFYRTLLKALRDVTTRDGLKVQYEKELEEIKTAK